MRINLTKLYLLLVILAPLTPRFSSADKTITHWITLTLAAAFGVFLTLIYNKKISFGNSFSFYPLYSYFTFVTIALLSVFFAINQTESLIALSRICVVLTHIYLFYTLRVYKVFSLKLITVIVSCLLFVEVILSIHPLYKILSVTKYDIAFATEFLLGIEGNKNITSASILVKIPFVFMLFDYSKNRLVQLFALIILFLAILNVLFLSARASYLALLIVLLILIIFKYQRENKIINLNFFKSHKYLLIIPFICYSIYTFSLPEDSKISVDKRYSSIVFNENDNSINQRLRYYSQAINYAIENPFMGAGIGNWKIISIKLDGKNITSYVVPNVLHNDFLEILGETNLMGMISYLFFFLSMLYVLFRRKLIDNDFPIYVGLSILIYLIDSTFNFPLYRASMQVNLLIIFLFVLLINYNSKLSFSDDK